MTHPEQTLRDKVWSVLDSVWVGDSEDDLYIKADAVIALVREALLSDKAVEAGCVARWGGNARRFATYAYSNDVRKSVRGEMYAALDAITTD